MRLFWLRRPHMPLVVLLVAMIAVFPLIERSGLARCLLNLLIVAAIVLSVKRVDAPRPGVLAVAVFGGLAVLGQALHEARVPGRRTSSRRCHKPRSLRSRRA